MITVIVPCYNAGARLRPVVVRLLDILEHVIVVDDGSTDEAIASIRDLPVQIEAFPENRGKGYAMLAGFRAALRDPDTSCIGIVDADGQHDPAEIPNLAAAFEAQNADLVIGSRVFDAQHVPWRSRFGNKLTIHLTAWLLGQKLPDTQSGFRLHSRRFIEDIVATVSGGRYEVEMEILVKAVREGYTVVPVPIQTIYEAGNPSSHFHKLRDSFRIYRRLFSATLRHRSERK